MIEPLVQAARWLQQNSTAKRSPRYLRFWNRDRLVIVQTDDLHEPGSKGSQSHRCWNGSTYGVDVPRQKSFDVATYWDWLYILHLLHLSSSFQFVHGIPWPCPGDATVVAPAMVVTRSRIGSVIERLAEILPELKEMQVQRQRHRSDCVVCFFCVFDSVMKKLEMWDAPTVLNFSFEPGTNPSSSPGPRLAMDQLVTPWILIHSHLKVGGV